MAHQLEQHCGNKTGGDKKVYCSPCCTGLVNYTSGQRHPISKVHPRGENLQVASLVMMLKESTRSFTNTANMKPGIIAGAVSRPAAPIDNSRAHDDFSFARKIVIHKKEKLPWLQHHLRLLQSPVSIFLLLVMLLVLLDEVSSISLSVLPTQA